MGIAVSYMFIVTPSGTTLGEYSRPSGIETVSKLQQLLNASTSMKVTELGIKIEVSLQQPSNAWKSMSVTELGIKMEVKLLQSKNAFAPMEVTE